MRTVKVLVLVVAVSTLPCLAHAGESPWPVFRHDLQNTGRTQYTGPAEPSVQWTFSAEGVITSSAVIGDNATVYFSAGGMEWVQTDSSLYALNLDGSLKWRYKTPSNVFCSPALGADGTIYISSVSPFLHAIEDSVTYGKLKWETPLSFLIHRSPTPGPDGTIYAGSLDFTLYAIAPDGGVKWSHGTDWCVFSTPALGLDGKVYFGSKDHKLYCLEDSISYSKPIWEFAAGEFYDGHLVDCSPAIGSDGTIYVGTDPYGAAGQTPVPVDQVFFAVNPDGTQKWSFSMDDGVESSPAIGPDGTIYVGSQDNYLYAVEDQGNTGNLRWRFETRGAIDSSPAVDGCGTIYFGSRDSTLYALNPDGSLRWSFPAGAEIESSPAIDDNGVVYFGTLGGTFYALGSTGPDVGVDAIYVQSEVGINTVVVPQATVTNYRSSVQSFDITCVIDIEGSPVYQDTKQVIDLTDAASAQVLFEPWTVGPDLGVVYDIHITTALAGDNNMYNDSMTAQATSIAEAVGVTDDNDRAPQPKFALGRAYPNPFNPTTTIRFEVPASQRVRLGIYDMVGRLTRVLINGEVVSAGQHEIAWDGRDNSGRPVPSGTYFYRLEAGESTETRRMALVR